MLASHDLSQQRLFQMGTKECFITCWVRSAASGCAFSQPDGLRQQWTSCCDQSGLNCRQKLCCQMPQPWLRGRVTVLPLR